MSEQAERVLIVSPSGRESAQVKARRYLAEGRIDVLRVSEGRIYARARGDGAVYILGWANGRWACSCPARSDKCSHLLALRLVTNTPAG